LGGLPALAGWEAALGAPLAKVLILAAVGGLTYLAVYINILFFRRSS
jgi:hypothetical protein